MAGWGAVGGHRLLGHQKSEIALPRPASLSHSWCDMRYSESLVTSVIQSWNDKGALYVATTTVRVVLTMQT